jgi:hypothetical protein
MGVEKDVAVEMSFTFITHWVEMAALRPFACAERALRKCSECVGASIACRSARHGLSQRDEFHYYCAE